MSRRAVPPPSASDPFAVAAERFHHDLNRALGAEPRGADSNSALAVAVAGSRYYRAPGRDYVAVAELLTAAGNEIEPSFLEFAQGPLVDWLDARTATEE